ncbi:MAG: GspL/Epsl periplasmic domain-containing protein, partial [Thermodesulfobacteriota bacterium]|nr:GspL/Epsl periplasmic domain-containing protein [Thermodesulfobacteriota bacterium]
MSKRFIGVDLEGAEVRVAVLTAVSGRIHVELDKRSFDTPVAAAAAITEILGGKITLGDRLVAALPCRAGMFRRLHFPFREKNKIEAALPLELSSCLPISLDEQAISFLPPRSGEDGYDVDVVVAKKTAINDLITHFPDSEQNPLNINIFPFALVSALSEPDGLLIYCRHSEIVVARVGAGIICDYRLLPGTGELDVAAQFDLIANQVSQFENSIGQEGLPLWMIGAGVTDELLVCLYATDRTILTPTEAVFDVDVSYEMAPVALLALAEMAGAKKTEQLNFRQGEFAARGQLELLRSKLVAVALLLLLVVVGGAVTMQLGYLQTSREEDYLKQQMAAVFHQVMPAGSALVDVPLQLESQLKSLQQRVQIFGLGGHGAAT